MQSIEAPWAPLTEWPHKWPTPGALKQMVWNREKQGESLPWVRRIGRKILVNSALFFAWIESQPTTTAKAA